MFPLTALAWALGSSGLHLRGEIERLVAPAAGLFPAAVALPLLATTLRRAEAVRVDACSPPSDATTGRESQFSSGGRLR